VLVEKPMTDQPATSAVLVEEAARRGLVLMVDHTFVYTGAVRAITDLSRSGALGDIYYYDSTRVNLGLFQRDVSVIWDLAVHDFSIMDHLMQARPVAVTASGACFGSWAISEFRYRVTTSPRHARSQADADCDFTGDIVSQLVNTARAMKLDTARMRFLFRQ
jgi:predicted dehydrogenase